MIWRYALVAVAIAGAAVWTIEATSVDPKHSIGAPTLMGNDAGPDDAPSEQKAPSLKDMFLSKDGQERVSCVAACRLERYCSLRDVDECIKASCTGAVRVLAQSDDIFAKAGDCTEAASAPCGEACARCGKANDIQLCTQTCVVTTRSNPGLGYRKARCMLEQPCDKCEPFLASSF